MRKFISSIVFCVLFIACAGEVRQPQPPPSTDVSECPTNQCNFPEDGSCTSDVESDCICEPYDNCPGYKNCDQLDTDGDGLGDPCDSTPNGEDTAAIAAHESRLDAAESAMTSLEARVAALETNQTSTNASLLAVETHVNLFAEHYNDHRHNVLGELIDTFDDLLNL